MKVNSVLILKNAKACKHSEKLLLSKISWTGQFNLLIRIRNDMVAHITRHSSSDQLPFFLFYKCTEFRPFNFRSYFITGRNEVAAKVMFLLVSVILLTGGVWLNACWDTPHPEQTSPEQTPPRADTPRSRHTPGADSPPPKQTPAYGQWAVGTYPTGMHSCTYIFIPFDQFKQS